MRTADERQSLFVCLTCVCCLCKQCLIPEHDIFIWNISNVTLRLTYVMLSLCRSQQIGVTCLTSFHSLLPINIVGNE